MIVTRTITRKVEKCMDCPYYASSGHEASCDPKNKLIGKYPEYPDIWSALTSHWEIDADCPIILGYAGPDGTEYLSRARTTPF